MASSNLAIRILAKNSSQAAFKEVSGGLSGIASAVLAPTKALGGLMDGLGKLGLAGLGVKALADTVGGLATSMVAGNAEFERYQTQFGVLLGSAEAAKERLKELADFGAKTPFELPEVVKADKILQSFGLHAEESAKRFGVSGKEIRTIAGDVAAGTGAGFEEISTYIGKLASGSTGLAISRFEELGIVTRQQLTQMGLEFSKSGELVSPLDKSMGVILQAMKGKFGGMMDAQSSTFEGMMSNLTDWIGQTKNALMAPIFDVLKEKLGAVLTFLGSDEVKGAIAGFAAFLSQGISQAITTISNLWTAAQPTIALLIDGFTRLSEFVGRFVQYLSPSNDYDLMGALFGPDVGPRIDEVVRSIKGVIMALTSLGAAGTDVQAALRQLLGNAVDLVIQILKDAVPPIVAQLGAWGKAFTDWIGPAAIKFLGEWPGILNDFLSWIERAAPPILRKLGEWALAFVSWIVPMLPELGKALLLIAGAITLFVAETLIVLSLKLLEWAWAFVQWVAPLIPPLLGELGKLLLDLGGWIITEALPQIGYWLLEWGRAFIDWISNDVLPRLPYALAEVWSALSGWLAQTASDMLAAGADLGRKLIQGIRAGLRQVQIPLPDIGIDWEEIVSALGSIWIPKFRVGMRLHALGDLIPELAMGTRNFGGGLALVGERGPELVGLPQGARVWSASESRGMMGGGNVYITVQGSVIAERDLTERLRQELVLAGKRNVTALGDYA